MELNLCKCVKCGEVKEPVAFVDGEPWCEDCFALALGDDRPVEEGEPT